MPTWNVDLQNLWNNRKTTLSLAKLLRRTLRVLCNNCAWILCKFPTRPPQSPNGYVRHGGLFYVSAVGQVCNGTSADAGARALLPRTSAALIRGRPLPPLRPRPPLDATAPRGGAKGRTKALVRPPFPFPVCGKGSPRPSFFDRGPTAEKLGGLKLLGASSTTKGKWETSHGWVGKVGEVGFRQNGPQMLLWSVAVVSYC